MNMKFYLLLAFVLMLSPSVQAAASGYYAPYVANASYPVMQGNDGKGSHYGAGTASINAYAIDFKGLFDVVASKDGVVTAVGEVTTKPAGCPTTWNSPQRSVTVKSSDGLYAYYLHLNSTTLKVNDSVVRGKTIIGKSGKSGCASTEHLHFQLSNSAVMDRANSVRVLFDDIGDPKETNPYTSYTSKNIPVATKTLKSLSVSCQTVTLNPAQTTPCTAKAQYTDNSNSDITKIASWVADKSNASVSSGVVTAKGAASNTLIKVSATYQEGSISQIGSSSSVTIAGVDGKLAASVGCTATWSSNKEVTGGTGTVYLFYSNICGANWAKVVPKNSTSQVTAIISRSSDNKSYSSSGNTPTPMVYAPSPIIACVSAKIGTGSFANVVCGSK